MISLTAQQLCWIDGAADDPNDQCAHGTVAFHVDGVPLVQPEDGDWAVAASALYLLRTLSDDHTRERTVAEGNFLFPHCGFRAWLCGGRYPVMCMGCDLGIDIWVRHKDSTVELSAKESRFSVSSSEWRAAVLGFAQQIEEFYARCTPKVEPDDELDRSGWFAFWSEWRERIHLAGQGDT